jgi:dephospho-CoA kinase
MKVLITGSSTVGKSSVIRELQRRGMTAIDVDKEEPTLVRLEIKDTGEPADWPEGYVDWSYYSWNLQQPALDKALARDDTVILGGIFGNQRDYYHLFDKIIVLTVSASAYKQRLDGRPRRNVGDSDQNMSDRLSKYPAMLERLLSHGAIPVSNDGRVETTAEKIIELIRQ